MTEEQKYLIKKCIKGDGAAQRALYLKYRVHWYSVCLRYAQSKPDADDLLQEGLITIFRDLKQYDNKKGDFGAWANKVLINAILQHIRKWKKLKFNQDILDTPNLEVKEVDVYSKLGAKELTKLIQSLPTGYRVVFNLYVVEGYKHQEIASFLGISESTSKTQLLKAKRMLRVKLEYVLQN